jgi:zinc transport system permease protein
MIAEFLRSWELFQDTYLTAVFASLMLSQVGVLVVARNQIFLAAAVAQASVLGVALALLTGFPSPILLALLCSIGAALLTAPQRRAGGTSHEEMTGWIFLLSASLSILLLARSPVGLREVQSLLASSLIGASRTESWIFALLTLGVVSLAFLLRMRLVLFVSDPIMAAAVGMKIGLWGFLIAGTLGLTTGLSIGSLGLLFTFGALVLPALIAKNLCSRIAPMFPAALAASLAGTLLGLLFAHHFDLPPGQMIVALLCAVLLGAWACRGIRTAWLQRTSEPRTASPALRHTHPLSDSAPTKKPSARPSA